MSPASPTDLAPRLRTALTPVVQRAGLLLEDLSVAAGGRRNVVRVVVDLPDGPGGVGSDALAEVSRQISAHLDQTDLVPGAYTLEVSTPGVDRALRSPRQFRRATGRLVRAGVPGRTVTGRVVTADDEGVELEVDGRVEKLAYDSISEARAEVELKRPPADGPQR